jgi:hypothetical protein
LLALSTPLLRGPNAIGLSWVLPAFGAPALPFVGVPVVLASGWVILALWRLGNPRWLAAGLLSAFVGLAVSATAGFVPVSGMSVELASALGVLEALVAGVLLADQFGYIQNRGLPIGLAVDIWVLMGVLLIFNGSLLLTPALSAAMGVIVASPVLVVALLPPDQHGRRGMEWHAMGGAAEQRRAPEQTVLWFLLAFFALPLCLATSYFLVDALAG